VSKFIEDECIPSTSSRDEVSSTSPMCGMTQGNDMVSGDGDCNFDSKLIFMSIHPYLIAMLHLWT
jgi:hypothetical protein